jgi:integrase
MEEEYIDISKAQRQYTLAVARLDKDSRISDHNKQLMRSFVRDAAIGKTVTGRRKKKIGHAALVGYITHLCTFILFVKKDLDNLTDADMEDYVEALESDVIRSRARKVFGEQHHESGRPYTPRYKVDNKVVVRKFYKWLWGENKYYPKIVEWLDTYAKDTEISALTQSEVQRLIDLAQTPLHRAFIQVLFDGGFRLGELLNIRLRHLRLRAFDENDPSKRCFSIRVPFSKTLPRTVFMPMGATTKWLQLWLENHPARPVLRPDGTLDAEDVTAQLFPLTDSGARHMVSRLGQRALAKRVYPHLLRHTSATFWCNKLSYFQMCKRFGWTMTSSMPQKYIDREGVEELTVAQKYHEEERTRLAPEIEALV